MATAVISLNACGGDEPDEPMPTPVGPNVQPNPETPIPDPAGTVEVNMLNNGPHVSLPSMGEIWIDAASNFVCGENSRIISVDAVNSLGNITTVPTTGFAESTAVKPGNGYIVRYRTDGKSKNGKVYYGVVRYARLYVVDNLLENGGATVKYQAGWSEPLDVPIKFVEEDVEIPYWYSYGHLMYDWDSNVHMLPFEAPVGECTVKSFPQGWSGVIVRDGYIYISTAYPIGGDIVVANSHGEATVHVRFVQN